MYEVSEPLVSVIIPCYNYSHVLPDTLNSLLNQTYRNWECIIIDDGSTDATAKVVETYAKKDLRFKYILQENKGPNAARNNGLRNCKGSYIQFLDADDLLERKKIEIQLNYLIQNPEVDIVYGEARYFITEQPDLRLYSIRTSTGEDKPWMPKVSGKGVEILIPLLKRNIMVNSSPLIRKELVKKVDFTDDGLWQAEDWHFWIMCALSGAYFQFVDYPDTFALIRFHSISNSSDRWKIFFSELLMRKKINKVLYIPELINLNLEIAKQLVVLLEKLADKTVIYHNKKLGIQRLVDLYKITHNSRLLLNICYAVVLPAKVFAKCIKIQAKFIK